MARVPDLTVDDLAEADRDLLKRPRQHAPFPALGNSSATGPALTPGCANWPFCKWAGGRALLMNGRIM